MLCVMNESPFREQEAFPTELDREIASLNLIRETGHSQGNKIVISNNLTSNLFRSIALICLSVEKVMNRFTERVRSVYLPHKTISDNSSNSKQRAASSQQTQNVFVTSEPKLLCQRIIII